MAFTISAPDCGSYFFEHASEKYFCKQCDSYLDDFYLPSSMNMKSNFRNFGYTYDGRLIVSNRGKSSLNKYTSTRISFSMLNQSGDFHALLAHDELRFDTEARGTRFLNMCDECGRYDSVVGATPAVIPSTLEIDHLGFFRTDVEFGSGREKTPLFIVGGELKELLEAEYEELEFSNVMFS